MLIEPVVFVVAAKLLKSLRNDGFLLGDDVAPDLAVRQRLLRRHRAIRIDVIAGMDEEIRALVPHGAIATQATARRVDAPALPDDVAARLEGKSSLGRLGLLTHATAGFVDPGFSGHVTLERANVATLPIVLHPGMKIGQLCFFRLSSPAQAPYGSGAAGSHYQGQRGPTASRSHRSFRRIRIEDPGPPGDADTPTSTDNQQEPA